MSKNRRILISSLTVAALAAFAPGLGAQPVSPLNGTWMINLAKSTYNPGQTVNNTVLYEKH